MILNRLVWSNSIISSHLIVTLVVRYALFQCVLWWALWNCKHSIPLIISFPFLSIIHLSITLHCVLQSLWSPHVLICCLMCCKIGQFALRGLCVWADKWLSKWHQRATRCAHQRQWDSPDHIFTLWRRFGLLIDICRVCLSFCVSVWPNESHWSYRVHLTKRIATQTNRTEYQTNGISEGMQTIHPPFSSQMHSVESEETDVIRCLCSVFLLFCRSVCLSLSVSLLNCVCLSVWSINSALILLSFCCHSALILLSFCLFCSHSALILSVCLTQTTLAEGVMQTIQPPFSSQMHSAESEETDVMTDSSTLPLIRVSLNDSTLRVRFDLMREESASRLRASRALNSALLAR